MAKLILRQRAKRDILLQQRRDASPLAVGVADHELVVGQGQQQLGQVLS
jgi:hypothetical protein